MRLVLNGMIAAILVLTVMVPLAAASSPSSYSVNVTSASLSVAVSLNFFQNITAFESSFSLPTLHSVAVADNSTRITGAVQEALRAKNPNAQVSNLRLEVDSSPWSDVTNLQWFNISLRMDVAGVSVSKGSAVYVDLSWKSFAVSSDISMSGVEVNNIGAGLLLKVASQLAALKSSNPAVTFAYSVDDKPFSASEFPFQVSKFSTLNFTGLASHVSNWKETRDTLAQSSTWVLDPAETPSIKFITRTPEAGGAAGVLYELQSTVSASVAASGNFVLNQDTIILRSNSFPETLMTVTIIASSVTVVGATLYERRLRTPIKRKPRK